MFGACMKLLKSCNFLCSTHNSLAHKGFNEFARCIAKKGLVRFQKVCRGVKGREREAAIGTCSTRGPVREMN